LEANKLILASSSEIRKNILSNHNYLFEAVNHKFDENIGKNNTSLTPAKLSLYLAEQKSLSLSNDYKDQIILGCDQVCVLENKIFSKPITKEIAILNLSEMSGKTHQLIGSYSFTRNSKVLFNETIVCNMTMQTLTIEQIKNYVDTDKPLKSCGAYMFEKNGYKLFSKVEGSLEAINGLPFTYLSKKLKQYV
jgi:septum formation protein